jgi:transporter family protein
MEWLVYALLSALFAALVAILAKIGIQGIDSTVATAVRATIIAVFMVGVVTIQGTFRDIAAIPRGPLLFIFLSGVAGALSWLFYFQALQVGKVSQVAPIDRLSIVFAIVLAAIFLGEKVNTQLVIGVVLMVLGAVVIAIAPS